MSKYADTKKFEMFDDNCWEFIYTAPWSDTPNVAEIAKETEFGSALELLDFVKDGMDWEDLPGFKAFDVAVNRADSEALL